MDTLKSEPVPQHERIFPELEIVTPELLQELKYLRATTKEVEIVTYPPTADIFFNDQLLGSSPQVARVNPEYPENTVSASYVLYLEEFKVLSQKDIDGGRVCLSLQGMKGPVDPAEAVRAPEYITWRYKFAHNPPMMRALSHYFLYAGWPNEARDEAEELVKAAPYWYLAHNQAGHIAARSGDFEEAARCFRLVTDLRPDNCIGYYNLACVFSAMGRWKECIAHLRKICKCGEVLNSYGYLPFNVVEFDEDFAGIRENGQHKGSFRYWERRTRKLWEFSEHLRNAAQKSLRRKRKSRQVKRSGRKRK